MSVSHDSDRNLLFGIFALQVNFVDRDTLLAAMNDWVRDKQKTLGQVLLEKACLTSNQVNAIEAVLAEHLKAHDNDVEKSLRAMSEASPVYTTIVTAVAEEARPGMPHFDFNSDAETTRPYQEVVPLDGGRFVRGRFHQEGGLGRVYYAEDTELHREVALKEIKPRFADDAAFRGRFVIEAEITGGLEHPGIVPVYGLGAFADGRPYYAMRFIRGENLKDAIERFHAADSPERDPSERSLAFRQLLRRFIDTCNAVAYAHSRGVVHRDLKPANVMLGKYGETLVVDWGLAKLGVEPKRRPDDTSIEPILRPSSGSNPYAFSRGGTVPFMSPEQAAERDDIEPASDIYSLGSTLYVLLTRQRPFEGNNDEDTRAKVKRGEFKPPRAVNQKVPAPLDAICRKAMSLQTSDRYETALDLAADVEHWLADEPVSAYPEPWTVRAGRWGRRHRSVVVGTAVCLVTAVAALSISTGLIWAEQRETEKQRLLAVKTFEKWREQSLKFIETIVATEPEMATQPAFHEGRRQLLTNTSATCRNLREQDPDDLELRKRTAQIFRFAANFHRLTNETREAESLYKDSISLQEKLAYEYGDEPEYRLQLAATIKDYANLQFNQCRLTEAADGMSRTRKIADDLLKSASKRPPFIRLRASALHHQTAIDYVKGKPQMATVLEVIGLYRGLLDGPDGKHPYDLLMLAAALNSKALIERDAGELKVAGKTHREVNDILDDQVRKRPKKVSFPDLLHFRAHCRVEQAKSWAKDPKFVPLAEKTMKDAIDQWIGLVRDYPGIPIYQEALAVAYRERGQMREQLKGYKDAKGDFSLSQKALVELARTYRDLPELQGELGKVYAGMGRVAWQLKETEADKWFEMARVELREVVEKRAPDHAQMRLALEAMGNAAPK